MTLSNFKYRLKVGIFICFSAFYGIAFYSLGRVSLKQPSDQFVKGASSSTSQNLGKLQEPQPYSDQQRAEVISSYVNTCSNSTYGFQISYPKDWFTTYNNDPQKCLYFAPYTFVVPQIPDLNFVPITVSVVKLEDWQATSLLYQNPSDLQNVTSVKNIEINGAPVVIVESQATGKGNAPKGMITTSYLIFNSKWPIVISYVQQDQNDDILKYQGILSDMANSLKYF